MSKTIGTIGFSPSIKTIYETIKETGTFIFTLIVGRVTYIVGGRQTGTTYKLIETVAGCNASHRKTYFYSANDLPPPLEQNPLSGTQVLRIPGTQRAKDNGVAQSDIDRLIVDSFQDWLDAGEIEPGSTVFIDDWWFDKEPTGFEDLMYLLEVQDIDLVITCKYESGSLSRRLSAEDIADPKIMPPVWNGSLSQS